MSNVDIKTQLSGLVPFEKYDYIFEGMGGNWPCIVTPFSGTVRPYGDSINIDGKVHFCTTKTSCASDDVALLPYNTGVCDPNPNLFTTIRLSLKPESFDYTLYTDTIIVACDNCFAQPTITVPNSISLTQAQGNEYTLNASVVGIQPNESYTFNFSSLDANWPVRINPVSGIIKSPRDRANISVNLVFCTDPLLCTNPLDYTTNESCLLEKNLYAMMQLSLTPVSCEGDVVISNIIAVYCKDCLPLTTIKILPTTKKIVTSAENTAGLLLEPSLVGLTPNESYTYEFKSVNSNWPVFISPVSGIVRSSTSTSSLSSQLFFCANTTTCPPGSRGVLEYSLDTILSDKVHTDPFINLQLELQSLSCGSTHKSDTLIVYCNDCIAKSDVKIVTTKIT